MIDRKSRATSTYRRSAGLLGLGGGTATATQSWAPAATAKIHPGTMMMYTQGAQCTANFVYGDGSGATYVGYAAHCAGLGTADTNGCLADSLPLDTRVSFNEGASLVDEGTVVGGGTLVYSSWLTMHQLGTTDANTCAYNDLALAEVDAVDVAKVNPSVPLWGGPTGIDTDGTAAADRVYTYGNTSLRVGITQLSPHTGISLGDDAANGGWSHPLYTVTPGIPGDSGSGFLSADGSAIGVLSTLGLAPLPASNNIGDLAKGLAFAPGQLGHLQPGARQRHRAFQPGGVTATGTNTPRTCPGRSARPGQLVVRTRPQPRGTRLVGHTRTMGPRVPGSRRGRTGRERDRPVIVAAPHRR